MTRPGYIRCGLVLAFASFLGGYAPSARAFQREPIRLTLEGGTGWINTGGPIHAEDLKGKIVILDFWTFCCINCHHVLPDLAFLENKYKDELVVIGVHTPKFTAEQDTENLRKKVAEYRIKHPVINDAKQSLWTHYGVESWPTIAVFDAKGIAIYAQGGEGQREILDRVIARAIETAKTEKVLDTRPFVVRPETEKTHDGVLKYPGKITADAHGKRLFITDTGHNRIVVTDLQGKGIATIGSGREGKVDGDLPPLHLIARRGLAWSEKSSTSPIPRTMRFGRSISRSIKFRRSPELVNRPNSARRVDLRQTRP